MKENELKEIIKRGENDTVEFKQKLSSTKNLAVLIASFANSYGGKILIGVTNKSKVRGVGDALRRHYHYPKYQDSFFSM